MVRVLRRHAANIRSVAPNIVNTVARVRRIAATNSHVRNTRRVRRVVLKDGRSSRFAPRLVLRFVLRRRSPVGSVRRRPSRRSHRNVPSVRKVRRVAAAAAVAVVAAAQDVRKTALVSGRKAR